MPGGKSRQAARALTMTGQFEGLSALDAPTFLTVATCVTALLGLVTAPVAQAELLHPRQEWLRESNGGLFLHWGMFTAPTHTDCSSAPSPHLRC